MLFTLLDCYTDEPAGLGVPPYIGTYPRYLAGAILESKNKVCYLTIDDLRYYTLRITNFNTSEDGLVTKIQEEKQKIRTNIKIKNLTPNIFEIPQIFKKTDILIIIAGIHTPGKYLSALPGTTREVDQLLRNINYTGFTVLTGPAANLGSGLYGGKIAREVSRDFDNFNLIVNNLEFKISDLIKNKFDSDIETSIEYKNLKTIAIRGAEIVRQYPNYPNFLIAEIETSKGCPRKPGCSFCTEPLKSNIIQRRSVQDIIAEVQALYIQGIRNFRLGKQSCFYSFGTAAEIEKLLKGVREFATILHIDNANPVAITDEKTKIIVKYCTEGNIAALGVESFDPTVIKANNLNSDPETSYQAIQILNKYGAQRGTNGMPLFLPGINILFGLDQESKKTHEENMFWLKKILEEGLLVRRINIRQVVIFPGTSLSAGCRNKYIRKNKKYYWKWRNDIRQSIDAPMLKRLLPIGTILKGIRTEIYDGNTTFGRQFGTYPLIIGIKKRLALDQFIDVTVSGHMLRSIVANQI
ncbi:MAG TPA: radical SAM protein [Candidatus Deferrimicrobium sp.]|nr:radical SAM protein [Candidatus Deferrimicrobium sp.]